MYYDGSTSLSADLINDATLLGHKQHNSTHRLPLHAAYSQQDKPPTPPPEMCGFDSNLRNGVCANGATQSAYAATSQLSSFNDPQEHDWTGTSSQPLSPSTIDRSSSHYETASEPSISRRSSHANSIAPSFQIPKTVNDSGGSLADLAAQITCLFWFESSELLQQIEQTPHAIIPIRVLAKDAIPTIGFRKWVTMILSNTAVGANVVLLALLFIHRLKTLNRAVKGKPGSEFRLLTVALMLGNKFLDDNTYTNKTWAEVSGINVSEVHIMEVEFLSNMKYCLYTSLEQWTDWQALLGRFASYVDRAMHPMPLRASVPAPVLPPASSLRLPIALPSPPASILSSPPYQPDRSGQMHPVTGVSASMGLTPAPSPLAPFTTATHESTSRKRSRDESLVEPAPKRLAQSAHRSVDHAYTVQAQRAMLPTLPPPSMHSAAMQGQQLPPLSVPARAMGLVYPHTAQSTPPVLSAIPDLKTSSTLSHSQSSSRQNSPYWRPADDMPRLPHPSNTLQPLETSPSSYLQQRSSPYRPVHNVSTLLYPPPSAAIHARPQQVEHSQMHYQPLGKAPRLHTGRLPTVTPVTWTETFAMGRSWDMFATTASARHPLTVPHN